MPGTRPRTVSAIVVMRGPPSTSNVAVALTSTRSGVWPPSASVCENAIA